MNLFSKYQRRARPSIWVLLALLVSVFMFSGYVTPAADLPEKETADGQLDPQQKQISFELSYQTAFALCYAHVAKTFFENQSSYQLIHFNLQNSIAFLSQAKLLIPSAIKLNFSARKLISSNDEECPAHLFIG